VVHKLTCTFLHRYNLVSVHRRPWRHLSAAPADALALRAASDEHERTPRLDSSSIPMRATPLELRISSALTLTLSSPA
jgi:hypothetical protein